MANNDLLEEARRRGLMPSAPPGLLEEARKRGLMPEGATPYAPIPAPVKPELTREASLMEQMQTRGTYVGSGATAGSMIGVAGGPPGILAGGVLGAAAGSLIYDLSEVGGKWVKSGEPPPLLGKDPLASTKRAGQEMLTEAKWGGGTMAAGPIIGRAGRRILGKTLGLRGKGAAEARRAADLAHVQGVELGPTHVSRSKLVRALPKVLGVFPYTGTPYRTGQARVVGQLDDRAADLLNTLAPASTRYDVAKGLTKAAVKRYAKFDRVASALYDQFYKIAEGLSVKNIVPTQPLQKELAEMAEREGIEQITLQSGKPFRQFGADEIGVWLKQVGEMPEHITVTQARGLERQLNTLLRTGTKEGWDVSRLSGMKAALTQAKNSMDVSRLDAVDAERVLGAWNTANEFFGKTRDIFKTPTAKRFGRVNKNIFNKGVFKPGTISQDQVFEAVFQVRSPDALSDLRRLVGPAEFKKSARKFLDTAFDASRVPPKEGSTLPEMFSAADFEKRLGLNADEGWETLGEMLKGSDVSVRDWRDFLETAKRATDITIRDPATFLTRRLVLGASLAGGVLVGGGHITLPAAAVVATVLRGGSSFMMSKKHLHMMTRVIADTTSDHLRRTFLTRLLRLSGNDREESVDQNFAP